jgi:bacteriocin-like protein
MDKHVKQSTQSRFETVDTSELTQVSGGNWKYTSRLGAAGAQLEAEVERKFGNPFGPKTLDEAARGALEHWVSIP